MFKQLSFDHLIRVFFLYGFFLFCFVSPIEAQNMYKESAQFLAEVGVKDYERGDVQQAMHEFSKALMLDPQNQLALSYINRFKSPGNDQYSETCFYSLEHELDHYQKVVETLKKNPKSRDIVYVVVPESCWRKGEHCVY